MCGKLRIQKSILRPGMVARFITLAGQKIGRWGFSGGMTYNVRSEKLETYWLPLLQNRGVIEVDSFFDKGIEFNKRGSPVVRIPILYDNNQDFSVITKDAVGDVKTVHPRMPVVIEDTEAWLKEGKLIPCESDIHFV